MKARIHPGLAQLEANMARLNAVAQVEKALDRSTLAVEKQRKADRARVLRELYEVLEAERVQIFTRNGQRLVSLAELEKAIAECMPLTVRAAGTEPDAQGGE